MSGDEDIEQAELEQMHRKSDMEAYHLLREKYLKTIGALQKISRGEGRYSQDALTFASNTVEDMQAVAVKTLQELGEYSEEAKEDKD